MNKYKFETKKMEKKELKKNFSKFILLNKYSNLKSNLIIKMIYRNFYFYKYSSISFFRRSCIKTMWSRSVFRFFKLCRYSSRFYFLNGFFIGVRQASF
jgi:ribosomal protein S14